MLVPPIPSTNPGETTESAYDLAGREDYSLSDDVPRKTVLLYIEKTLTILVSNAYM